MIILKKKHEERLQAEKELRSKLLSEQAQKSRKEKEELKADLHEVVANLCSINVVLDERNRWRIITELDPHMISMALERGNDRNMISYIAEGIKCQIEREIMSCNIQRPDNFRLGRHVF
jgi:hypothetical protein